MHHDEQPRLPSETVDFITRPDSVLDDLTYQSELFPGIPQPHRRLSRLGHLSMSELVQGFKAHLPHGHRDEPAEAPLDDQAKHVRHHYFEELVARTQDISYSVAISMTEDPQDAQDVVQEAYRRAYVSLPNFRGDEAQFSTWLHRITHNAGTTFLDRRSRWFRRYKNGQPSYGEALLPEPEEVRHDFTPDDASEQSYLREQLLTSIEELSPNLKNVVVMYDIMGLPHDAIAEELGISLSASKVRLFRARSKLRERLGPLLNDVELDEQDDQIE
jgi:RNA polymerase sigma-70 factor, ECF subfamily